MTKQEFLSAIAGSDVERRFAAWRAAGEMDASVVPELIELAESGNPGVAKAAQEALMTMTHAVGKDWNDAKRQPLATALNQKHTVWTLRCLSHIGGEKEAASIAKSLASAALREEAIYALERIPGAVVDDLLVAAYANVAEDFRPRLLYALGHRRTKKGAALAARAMMATRAELQTAGEWALGRIGPVARISMAPTEPHAQLRFIEGVVKEGNAALAIAMYKRILERPEEHLQCAALVGLGRIGSAEAAQAVFAKLKSPERKVRITAAQVWARFAA